MQSPLLTEAPQDMIVLAPAPYVTVPVASRITGLSEKAIRRKIEDGKWLEGREYRRSPDGGIFISVRGFEAWVEGRGSRYEPAASGSHLRGKGALSATR